MSRVWFSGFLRHLTVACVVALLGSSAAIGQVLVLSPHPDDDIITSAGVILDALRRAEPVTVVYLTNGDFNGTNTGLIRQDEAVAAQVGYLGTVESDLIFLGYPDSYTKTLYDSYPSATDRFATPNGQSVTYGDRGLGGSDYHFYRFGAHGLYNRANMVLDLKTILQTYRPAHIFTTSQYDNHSDHATAYNILKEALTAVLADLSYKPVVHTTVVHSLCCDPSQGGAGTLWPDQLDPTSYHSILPDIPTVPVDWNKRESLDVPLLMQQPDLLINTKYLAIQAHASQAFENFLPRFVHKDELFWPEDPRGGNAPPIVNAGVDQLVPGGALVSLNGGGSSDPEGLPLTFTWSQAEGPAVTLVGANTATLTFTAPQVGQTTGLVFRLVVSDGEFASPPDLVTVTVQRDAISSNIAPLGAVTASSDNPWDGQQATKAVDGVVDGWPGDYTREWATNGQGVGAWIRLSWSAPYLVDRIILYDRPNLSDNVTGGTLTFSDGTTISVGSLDNAGAGNTVTFSARSTTSVTFTVTSVSASTQNVGLAEIEVYAPAGATSAPVAPSGLTATAASSSQINLAWVDNATNETGYRVERSTDGTNFTTVATLGANVTTYANTGLATSTSYSYHVLASNSVGNSGYSNTASATTSSAPTVPAVPNGLTATPASSSQINLAWVDNATNEAGYRVERSTDGTNFTTVATLGPNVTTYANTGLAASTSYSYRVLASNSVGNSGYSNTATATTSAAAVPVAPSGLTATAASSSQINLAWVDNATNETGYRVERSTDGTNFTTVATLGANVTTYTNTGLAASTSYSYRVLASNSVGNSGYSNTATATTSAAPAVPVAPSGLTATAASSSQINLAWVDNATNETSYRVERSTDGTNFTTVATLGANVTTYANTGLAASTSYSYRVLASNSVGNSGYSNTATATTSAAAVPVAPSGLTATAASSSQINLAWVDNATNETGYRVERSTDGTNFTTVATLGANVTTYTNTGLAASTSYSYRVLASNSVGNSGYSNTATATTSAAPAVPVAPSGLTATAASSSQINLAWVDNATNETGYRVERSTDGTNFTTVATLGANVTTYANTGLAASTSYSYRVLASNSVGNSGYSNTATATTSAAPAVPVAPSGLTATAASSSQINLAWVDNATNETGYRVERSTDGTNFTTVATLGPNVTTYANTGLAASTSYSYRVLASNSVGNSGYSNTATATTSASTTSTNIAPLAAVTASSENAADGQQATKAVDGVVDGWPGDYTREWATNGQRVGAWIKLSWSKPYLVDSIVLYDRPNSNDRVTGGTLAFSDGTTVSVTSLSNNGAAKTVTFTPRNVTSVTFTVTSVSATTQNVGLAEIAVYGR